MADGEDAVDGGGHVLLPARRVGADYSCGANAALTRAATGYSGTTFPTCLAASSLLPWISRCSSLSSNSMALIGSRFSSMQDRISSRQSSLSMTTLRLGQVLRSSVAPEKASPSSALSTVAVLLGRTSGCRRGRDEMVHLASGAATRGGEQGAVAGVGPVSTVVSLTVTMVHGRGAAVVAHVARVAVDVVLLVITRLVNPGRASPVAARSGALCRWRRCHGTRRLWH